jgi:PAT family beta-lactamase induction signal transducer AmpG
MLPNLLATRRGAIAAFFALYVVEGLPQGFATVAVATQLRREGFGPGEIGAFVGAFFLPWALKWLYAPFVDMFRSQRFGHRRGWILFMQVGMAASLLALLAVPLRGGFHVAVALFMLTSACVAIYDVAVDALAVNTLSENGRGLGNGVMFAGAMLGYGVGGSGVLFLLSRGLPFDGAIVAVAAVILALTTFIVLPMRERATTPAAPRAVAAELRTFAGASFRAFMGTKGSFRAVFFALLPAGASALQQPLNSNMAVEFGMSDTEFGTLNLLVSIVAAAAMIAGGWLSDRWGRRRMMALYIAGTSLPVLYLAWALYANGFDAPRGAGGAPIAPLISALWIASIWFAVFGGLVYAPRIAILMDVTDKRVAATQFAAYTALVNFSSSFTAGWEGLAVDAWGYRTTLLLDAVVGLVCLLLLPGIKPAAQSASDDAAEAALRARRMSLALGIACLSWLAYWPNHELLGKAQPIAGSLYTVVFVSSALFLLAGREVLGEAAGAWRKAALWVALLLLAMHARYWLDALSGMPGLHAAAQALLYAIPLGGGLVLLATNVSAARPGETAAVPQ